MRFCRMCFWSYLLVSLPMVDEMVSLAVFVVGAAPVVASLAEEELLLWEWLA